MKKLGKLSLKELQNESVLIEDQKHLIKGGTSYTSAQWDAMSANQKAQAIVNDWLSGDFLQVSGSWANYQSGACGDTVTINGNTYTAIVSVGLNVDFSGTGYEASGFYENGCGAWRKTYIGSNAEGMCNPEQSQSDDFYDDVDVCLNRGYN
jgi:hypothetical protein